MTWHGLILDYQGQDDWLEQRRAGIGASDVAGILGLSPYSTPFTVWADKLHDTRRDATAAMERGKRREKVILDEFEAETGLYVRARQVLVAHPNFEWARATLDGLIYETPLLFADATEPINPSAALGLVEAKHDGSFKRWDQIPDHHQIQVQWQLFVTGLRNAWLAVWHAGQPEIYEIETDFGLQQMMLDRVNDFRAKHIVGGIDGPTPPDPDSHPATTRTISDFWEPEDETIIELPNLRAGDLDALVGLKIRRDDLNEQIKTIENRIKVALAEATVGTIDGQVAVTWKRQHRDSYLMPAADFRVLLIKKRKGKE
jgi:putative phage-type endonuclease